MNQPTDRLLPMSMAALMIGVVAVCMYFGWFVLQANRQKKVIQADINNGSDIVNERPEDLVDIRSVAPDLEIPELEMGTAEPGRRVKDVIPEFAETNVYHVTYLPVDWEPGNRYPVIVEYAGNGGYKNQFGDVCTGRVDDSKLGYGISAGRGFIWVCLPFLNDAGTENSLTWWGDPINFDPQSTVDYCKQAVPVICEKYGGDPKRVLLSGFSRGAVACNFIGLHDDEIAKLWRGFVPYSHYDGVANFGMPGLDRDSAISRLKRLGDLPQFICAENGQGQHATEVTKAYLDSTDVKGDFTFRRTDFRNHNDSWILRPSPARDELRTWVEAKLK